MLLQTKPSLESFDSSFGVDYALLPRKERVALIAYLNAKGGLRRPGRIGCPARARDGGLWMVFRMNLLLQFSLPCHYWVHAGALFVARCVLEFHCSVDQRVERMVFADPDVVAGLNPGASLTYENRTSRYKLGVVPFDSEPFGVAISTVSCASSAFFVRHISTLRSFEATL